jgi:hypothetical protein
MRDAGRGKPVFCERAFVKYDGGRLSWLAPVLVPLTFRAATVAVAVAVAVNPR